MREALKEAGLFCLGLVFVASLIPPALIIGAIAMLGPLDRELSDDGTPGA